MRTKWHQPSFEQEIYRSKDGSITRVCVQSGTSLLLNKRSIEVKMGPLHECEYRVAPAFFRSQVDLFGPFDSFSNLNKRKSTKIWFVITCCTTTSAIDLRVMEDYSTEAFLMAFVRFACRVGHPKYLLPDEGLPTGKRV